MKVISTDKQGVIGEGTHLTFSQSRNVVSARYSGGQIQLGYLVGLMGPEGLRFRYVQLDVHGHLDSGHSRCEISKTTEGRIRIVEHFQWESREGSGSNVFEELK